MTNERKLELTLCGMLSYNLKAEVKNWGTEEKTFIVDCIGLLYNEVVVQSPYGGHDYTDLEDFKPLLHSLNKLTEPILDGGLIPVVELEKLGFKASLPIHSINDIELQDENYGNKTEEYFKLVEKLKEWHFNIYDLPSDMYIEKSSVK